MIHLICFSLRRRFLNRMALTLNGLTLLALIVLLNADHLSNALSFNLGELTRVGVDDSTRAMMVDETLWERAGFELVDEASIRLRWVNDHYTVTGAQDPMTQNGLVQVLLKNHQLRLFLSGDPSLEAFVVDFSTVNVTFDPPWDPMSAIRENVLFSVLTAAYFMVLNFIAVNSGEIMAEKTSNVLELVLSRLKPHEHFLAKLITGIASLLLQFLISGTMIGLVLAARWRLDRFVGLIRFATRLFKLDPELFNVETILSFLSVDGALLVRFGIALGILLLGMSILLVIIIMVSSRVKSAEEASMIQGPFYLGLLALYYVSLGLMNPVSLSSGMGRVLSMVPVGSMLVMGMRVLSGAVSGSELILTIVGSVLVLMVTVMIGYPIYRRGLTQR